MPFQFDFTRKIFQDLSQYEKDREEQSRNTMIESIREMFQKESYNTEEKEYLVALLSECLEQEKIEEQKIIVCRDWARETFKNTMVTNRSEEHTSELQSRQYLVCRLLLEKNKYIDLMTHHFSTYHIS